MRWLIGYDEALEALVSDVLLTLRDHHAFEEAQCDVWFEGHRVRARVVVRRLDGTCEPLALDADVVAEFGYALADVRDAARAEERLAVPGLRLSFGAWVEVDVTLLTPPPTLRA